jgi:hypothetical protein
MSKQVAIGPNRTGTATAPERRDAMVAATREFPPTSEGSAEDIAAVRVAYAAEAEPMGYVPAPAGLAGKVKAVAKSMVGAAPTPFMDKLGERLAFERMGVRLYEALISQHAASGSFSGGPSKADLEHILAEERRHFELLRGAIARLGGDPTAVTPSANLHATASKGIGMVLVDPRTGLLPGLEAVLLAELADGEGWDMLVALARAAGEDELVARFEQAQAAEAEHVRKVRGWIAGGHGRAASPGTMVRRLRATAPPAKAKVRRRRRRKPTAAARRPRRRRAA